MNETIYISHAELMILGDETRDYFIVSQTSELDVKERTYEVSVCAEWLCKQTIK